MLEDTTQNQNPPEDTTQNQNPPEDNITEDSRPIQKENLEGESYDHLKYIASESTTCFVFTDLAKRVKYQIRERYPEISYTELREMMFQNLKKFSINGQRFRYVSFPNYLGGHRWFIYCPRCNKHCVKLFLPNKHPDRPQKYWCKECHRLKNASSLQGTTKRYRKVIRPLKRLDAIKAQLLKRNLRPKKAKELLDEYDRIERELKNSPEYRLWEFRKKHK